jgi:hypothetical protein
VTGRIPESPGIANAPLSDPRLGPSAAPGVYIFFQLLWGPGGKGNSQAVVASIKALDPYLMASLRSTEGLFNGSSVQVSLLISAGHQGHPFAGSFIFAVWPKDYTVLHLIFLLKAGLCRA